MRHRTTYHSYGWYDDRYRPWPKPYGALAFMGDVFMLVITGGLWGIWIFVREMRRR
jgi:hypothetical protein